jgi:Leucine-rich repeat (LRR) protein
MEKIVEDVEDVEYKDLVQYDFEFSNKIPIIPTDINITDLHLSNCTQEIFDQLIIPENITLILFFTSDIEHLRIPEGITYCACENLGLKTLYIPDSMEIIYCDINCLKTLEIPEKCKYVHASYNKLTNITARTTLPNLLEIFLTNNRLKEINLKDCPELATIDCDVGVVISKELIEQMDTLERLDFQRFCGV